MRSRAIGAQIHSAVEALRLHLLHEFFQRARSRVFLRGRGNFPAPGLVVRVLGKERRGVPDSLQEKVYANRKIRRPNKACPALRDGFADRGKIIVPACRANNGVDAHGSKAANIFRSGVRSSEFNGYVDPSEMLMRKAPARKPVVPIHYWRSDRI